MFLMTMKPTLQFTCPSIEIIFRDTRLQFNNALSLFYSLFKIFTVKFKEYNYNQITITK